MNPEQSGKTVEQIRSEWEGIESRRPGGTFPDIEMMLNHEKAQQAQGGEKNLLDIISALHTTIAGYHVEMGVLLDTITALKGASNER